MAVRQELVNLAASSRHHHNHHQHHHPHHQDPAAANSAAVRGLGDHFQRMAAAEAAAAAMAAANCAIFPKQERPPQHVPTAAASFSEEAANLVMPRHMLFPVHKYFQ